MAKPAPPIVLDLATVKAYAETVLGHPCILDIQGADRVARALLGPATFCYLRVEGEDFVMCVYCPPKKYGTIATSGEGPTWEEAIAQAATRAKVKMPETNGAVTTYYNNRFLENLRANVPAAKDFRLLFAQGNGDPHKVFLGGRCVATCDSATMAARVANALNRYRPNRRGR